MMRSVTLVRKKTGDTGTFGQMPIGSKIYYSLELQSLGNEPNLSCIPAGTYTCHISYSPHFDRDLYHVLDVPGRDNILIHPGNWAGDVRKGLHCDLLGCIALGNGFGMPGDQQGILDSRLAIVQFMQAMNNEDFELVIVEAFA